MRTTDPSGKEAARIRKEEQERIKVRGARKHIFLIVLFNLNVIREWRTLRIKPSFQERHSNTFPFPSRVCAHPSVFHSWDAHLLLFLHTSKFWSRLQCDLHVSANPHLHHNKFLSAYRYDDQREVVLIHSRWMLGAYATSTSARQDRCKSLSTANSSRRRVTTLDA